MKVRRAALAAALFVCLVCTGRPATAQGAPLPSSALAARDSSGAWIRFWSSASAPMVWRTAPLAQLAVWQRGAAGVEWSEISLSGSGEAWRTRLVVARLDPSRLRFALDTAFVASGGHAPAWSVEHAPSGAVAAINAGQFAATMPWGWVVLNGRRWLPPQRGPLSAALAQDSSGALRWIRGDDVARVAATLNPLWAFQSYPSLLDRDTVPAALRAVSFGVSATHRDARAAICLARDGRVIVAITRFDGAGRALDFVPFGLTAPEMAGVMGALGCRDAMLLDGGISAQLRVRDASGATHEWGGLRDVPLALLAFPR